MPKTTKKIRGERKTIRLGKFFGNWLLLELDESQYPPFTPETWTNRWQNWLKEERRDAVEQYKEQIFLKQMEVESKNIGNPVWNFIKKIF